MHGLIYFFINLIRKHEFNMNLLCCCSCSILISTTLVKLLKEVIWWRLSFIFVKQLFTVDGSNDDYMSNQQQVKLELVGYMRGLNGMVMKNL